jgi:hypothetical protein
MLSVHGLYQDGNVILLEKIPQIKQAKVIITILEELPELDGEEVETPTSYGWLGALAGTAQIVGDIVQPSESTPSDWEVLES